MAVLFSSESIIMDRVRWCFVVVSSPGMQEMALWNFLWKSLTKFLVGLLFFSWSASFYPQVILNFRRKSVVGLSFDFSVLNFTKHTCYLIYNAFLFFSPVIQRQYHEKYGFQEIIPVAANDVAFLVHAVLLTAFTLYQVLIYERGSPTLKNSIAITSVVWVFAAICVFIAWPSQSCLWLIAVFNTIQVVIAVIKYTPQAVLNFANKCTDGWSIDRTSLDLLGGLTNYAQMAMQSIDQGSWINFFGNLGKNLLSLVTIFFHLVFMLQHYVLYPLTKEKNSSYIDGENSTPLIKSTTDPSNSENV